MAAVLAGGGDGVLSHRCAATLWRIRDGEGPNPDVTASTNVLSFDDLTQTVREAQFLRLYDRHTLAEVLARRPSAALSRLVPAIVSRSKMEDRFLWICARHRLPRPERQHRIGAKRYDFAWPEHRVVVETDGWQGHSGPHAFQGDRTSSNALQLAGWLVLRFTWEDLTVRARRVAATVRAALRSSSPSASARERVAS